MITKDTLSYLCGISMLSLSDGEASEYLEDLNARLSAIEVGLSGFDGQYVEAFDTAAYSDLRDDTAEAFADMGALISLAPYAQDNMIAMPKVVE